MTPGAGLVLASSNFGESYLLEWIAFVLAVAVFWRYILPPIRRMMNRQADAIRSSLEAGEQAKAGAERAIEDARGALEQARGEAERIVGQARRSAEQLVEEGKRRAEEDYRRILARTDAEVEMARTRMRAEVTAQVSGAVVAATEQVVSAELDVTGHKRLIDEAIAAAEQEAAV